MSLDPLELEQNSRKTEEDQFSRQMKEDSDVIRTIEGLVKRVASLEETLKANKAEIGHLQRHVKDLETKRDEGVNMQCQAEVKKRATEFSPQQSSKG